MRRLDDADDLEQCGIVGAAVVFVAMGIQQAGVARWNKDGCLVQASVKHVQASCSARASTATCMHQPHADFLEPADTETMFAVAKHKKLAESSLYQPSKVPAYLCICLAPELPGACRAGGMGDWGGGGGGGQQEGAESTRVENKKCCGFL